MQPAATLIILAFSHLFWCRCAIVVIVIQFTLIIRSNIEAMYLAPILCYIFCIRDNRIMHINTPRCLYICSSGCQKWRNIYQTVQRLVGQIDNVHGKETRHHKRGLMLFLRLSPLNRTRRWFHIKSIWIMKFVPFKRHHLSLQNNKQTHSISQTKWKFNRNLATVRNLR